MDGVSWAFGLLKMGIGAQSSRETPPRFILILYETTLRLDGEPFQPYTVLFCAKGGDGLDLRFRFSSSLLSKGRSSVLVREGGLVECSRLDQFGFATRVWFRGVIS